MIPSPTNELLSRVPVFFFSKTKKLFWEGLLGFGLFRFGITLRVLVFYTTNSLVGHGTSVEWDLWVFV